MRRERKDMTPSEYQTSGQYKPPGSVPIPVRPPGSKPNTPLGNGYEMTPEGFMVRVSDTPRLYDTGFSLLRDHPVFRECHASNISLMESMLNRLDELAEKEKKYDKDHGIGAKVQDRFLFRRFLRRD